MTEYTATIGDVKFGGGRPALIAGPCMAESLELCLEVATVLRDICRPLGIGFVFKASFDKANRSSAGGYRGPGLSTGLEWLARVRAEVGVPVLTDVHEVEQVGPTASVADCLQIPAFLCRQTDLLVAAGAAGKCVNIKKGQFMAPWDMKQAAEKVRSTGNANVMLTERGTFFGYNRLVTDLRSIPEMQPFAPVIFDATHSVQEPGGLGGNASGGQRRYAPMLATAAITAGVDGLFIEAHPNPDQAKSDAACQLPLSQMGAVLTRCLAVHKAMVQTT